jgi:ATP-dependent helicase STH1/SNF2
VVDEGHKAKNINTKIREAIGKFSVGRIKLVLTGTPVQNNLKELYSLLDIVQEGVLGS